MEDSSNDEQRHIESEVDKLRRNRDELRTKSSRQMKVLEDLKDAVRDLDLDSLRPHMEDNEFTRAIRSLENKLDKAMIKYNEAQSIRKTYEQIVRRLKEERVGFDNQLAAIERTLSAKQRDYEELMLLAGDANHARETALGELDRVRAGYEEERKRRERELRERHQVVQLRKQMLEKMKQREAIRNQLTGANTAEGDMATQNALNQKMLATEKLETRNKIDIFENAFRKIKEATGVSDVKEVILKIESQGTTTDNLIALTRENQSKMEALNEQRRKLKGRVEEVKFSGVAGGIRRKMVDDNEGHLAASATRLERARLKYERLNKVIIAMKAGVGHLQDKLEVVREELNGRRVELSDETVAEVLRESESVLSNVLRRLKAGETEMRRARITGGISAAPSLASLDSPGSQAEEALLSSTRPYNQRIDLSMEDDEDDIFGDDAIVIADGNDGELSRDEIKRASAQILQVEARKKRKPKKRTGARDDNGSTGGERDRSTRGPSSP